MVSLTAWHRTNVPVVEYPGEVITIARLQSGSGNNLLMRTCAMPQRRNKSPVFVETVREAFAKKSWTQLELAQRAGVCHSSLNLILKHKQHHNPSLDFGLRVLATLDVDLLDYAKEAGYLPRSSRINRTSRWTPGLHQLVKLLIDEEKNPEIESVFEILYHVARDMLLAAHVRSKNNLNRGNEK